MTSMEEYCSGERCGQREACQEILEKLILLRDGIVGYDERAGKLVQSCIDIVQLVKEEAGG